MTSGATTPEPVGTTVADRALRVATALSAEVVVLRERLEIVERLAAKQGVFGPGDVDAYTPSADEEAAAKTWRRRFLDRVFGAMRP